MKYEKCPHCKTPFAKVESSSNDQYRYYYIHDRYCEKCDVYFASKWNKYWYVNFLDSERKGNYIRRGRQPAHSYDIDKPAPYCLLYYHKPQIKPDLQFHEWLERFKADARKQIDGSAVT